MQAPASSGTSRRTHFSEPGASTATSESASGGCIDRCGTGASPPMSAGRSSATARTSRSTNSVSAVCWPASRAGSDAGSVISSGWASWILITHKAQVGSAGAPGRPASHLGARASSPRRLQGAAPRGLEARDPRKSCSREIRAPGKPLAPVLALHAIRSHDVYRTGVSIASRLSSSQKSMNSPRTAAMAESAGIPTVMCSENIDAPVWGAV